jgi:hypothetical protein
VGRKTTRAYQDERYLFVRASLPTKNKSPSHDLVLSLLARRVAKIWPDTCEEETCDRLAKDAGDSRWLQKPIFSTASENWEGERSPPFRVREVLLVQVNLPACQQG